MAVASTSAPGPAFRSGLMGHLIQAGSGELCVEMGPNSVTLGHLERIMLWPTRSYTGVPNL